MSKGIIMNDLSLQRKTQIKKYICCKDFLSPETLKMFSCVYIKISSSSLSLGLLLLCIGFGGKWEFSLLLYIFSTSYNDERNETTWKSEYSLYLLSYFCFSFLLFWLLLGNRTFNFIVSTIKYVRIWIRLLKLWFKWKNCLQKNMMNCFPEKARCFPDKEAQLFHPNLPWIPQEASAKHIYYWLGPTVPTFALNMRTNEQQKRTLLLNSFEVASSWEAIPHVWQLPGKFFM